MTDHQRMAVVESTSIPNTIAICGKSRMASAALSFVVHYVAIEQLPCRVVAVPNADDRGYDTWSESLRRTAALLGLPIVATADLEPDPGLLLVSLQYDRIVPVARFRSRRLYNIHFAALPRYRGVYTTVWPLLNGEREVGVTLHEMDAGADSGAIVDQRPIHVHPYTTARQLYEHYLDEGLSLFREWLPRLVRTIPASRPQDGGLATTYTSKSLDLRQRELSLSDRAERISRFVRAFTFPEYQRPTLHGRAIRSCAILPASTNEPPGTALHETAFSTAYATGGGDVIELIWA